MKKHIKMKDRGFTLLEMLIVLLIISVLILLFVPNLAKHRATIDKKSSEAIEKVVETQIDLYELEHQKVPTVEQLLTEKYITQDQYDRYQSGRKHAQ